MQANPCLRDNNSSRFAETVPAPIRGPCRFEAFAKDQDSHDRHRNDVSLGEQHWEQHQCPAGADTPDPIGHPETKRVKIRRSAKSGESRIRMAPIKTKLLDG